MPVFGAAAGQPRYEDSQAVVVVFFCPAIIGHTTSISSSRWAEIANSHRPDQFLDRISVEVAEGWSVTGASTAVAPDEQRPAAKLPSVRRIVGFSKSFDEPSDFV